MCGLRRLYFDGKCEDLVDPGMAEPYPGQRIKVNRHGFESTYTVAQVTKEEIHMVSDLADLDFATRFEESEHRNVETEGVVFYASPWA